jgi:6-phosphogluconolactonase
VIVTDNHGNDKLKFVEPDLEIFSDAVHLAQGMELEFRRLARSSFATKELFTAVLSGGGTPKSLYELLAAEPEPTDFPWNKVHFFWGDERQVPPTDPQSNFRMADEALLSKRMIPDTNIHRIRAEEPDPAKAAADYERELQTFFKSEPGEMPQFDLVLLGLGTDGHTASLFPDTPALEEKSRWCVSNWVEKLKTWRITLTLPVLNNALHVAFLVSGSDKASVLRSVLRGDDEKPYPAQLVRPTHGSLKWFVDRDAASLL